MDYQKNNNVVQFIHKTKKKKNEEQKVRLTILSIYLLKKLCTPLLQKFYKSKAYY